MKYPFKICLPILLAASSVLAAQAEEPQSQGLQMPQQTQDQQPATAW